MQSEHGHPTVIVTLDAKRGLSNPFLTASPPKSAAGLAAGQWVLLHPPDAVADGRAVSPRKR